MSEEVRQCVAKRLRQMLTYSRAMLKGDCISKEDEQFAGRRKKPLKSGMDRTGATTVVKYVTWPHEVMYMATRKPTAYQDFSIPLFVQG